MSKNVEYISKIPILRKVLWNKQPLQTCSSVWKYSRAVPTKTSKLTVALTQLQWKLWISVFPVIRSLLAPERKSTAYSVYTGKRLLKIEVLYAKFPCVAFKMFVYGDLCRKEIFSKPTISFLSWKSKQNLAVNTLFYFHRFALLLLKMSAKRKFGVWNWS